MKAIILCLGRIMFKNVVQKQLQHCILPNNDTALANVTLLIVGLALPSLHPNLWGRVCISIILKITANKDFLHQALGEEPLKYGEWKAYTSDKNEVKMQACRFSYFKVKECYLNFNLSFKFNLSSAMPGLPRKTKNTMVSWHNQKLL